MKSTIETFTVSVKTEGKYDVFLPLKSSPYYDHEESDHINCGVTHSKYDKFMRDAKKATGAADVNMGPYDNCLDFTFHCDISRSKELKPIIMKFVKRNFRECNFVKILNN